MLAINNLSVTVEGKQILQKVNLRLKPGEVGVLMGPNGSGKSSLALTLMGHPDYLINGGTIELDGVKINRESPDRRALRGLFLGFQYPVGVSGVSPESFLKQAYEAVHCRQCPRGSNPEDCRRLGVGEFRRNLREAAKKLKIKPELLQRSINEGFSGGEKKKVEVLQLTVLKPKYAILDEIDSGLDIDGLKVVAAGINGVRGENKKLGVLLITHYQRILQYIKPAFVGIMSGGKIVKYGGEELAKAIEKDGYQKYA